MHRYSLKFRNPQIETLYQTQNLSHQVKLFSTFIIFQFIFLSFLAVFTIIRDPKNYDHITIFALSACFLLILWRIRFKWPRFYQIGLNIFFMGFGVVLTEFALLIRISDNWFLSPEVIAFIIPIQSFCSLMLLLRLNWLFSSIIYCLNLVYFLFRMIDFEHYTTQIYVWVSLFMGVLNFSYMAFREQRIYRELFKSNHDSFENLNLFHLLLRNILPSSIFIINYDNPTPEIEFINTQSLKLLNKTLDDEHFIANSRCIDKSAGLKKRKPLATEVNYETIKDFWAKMCVLDEHFESYKNNISQILYDHFHSLKNGNSRFSTDGLNREIQFLSINLSRTTILDSILTKPSHYDERMLGITPSINSERDHFRETQRDMNNMMQPNFIDLEPKVKYYEMKFAKIRWNEKNCLIVLLSDITKSKKIIELKNLDKHKNQLLASISHDLRTPLNGVIGMINATISEVKDEKPKDFLKLALRSANLLDFLIKDILDFSQMSYKQLRLNVEYIDIKTVIQEVFCLMRFQAHARSISLEVESYLPDGIICKSDPNRIKQVLINLLGNAIKFTKEGFVKLKVELLSEEENRRKLLKFSVSDTGVGIRSEDQCKLFRFFGKLQQEDPEINKHGIGLGLAISNNLAKLLNPLVDDSGVHVESCFGKGSTFWFFVDAGSLESPMKKLPIVSYSSPNIDYSPQPQTIELRIPIFDRTKPSVLIVDDDMINIYVLEKYLENFQIEVMRAMNGIEALELVEREVVGGKRRLALILMDCNMPLMNGLEATEKILKALDVGKKERIPIVGISANDSHEDVEKCKQAGMISFIVKPVQKEEFCHLIQEFIM